MNVTPGEVLVVVGCAKLCALSSTRRRHLVARRPLPCVPRRSPEPCLADECFAERRAVLDDRDQDVCSLMQDDVSDVAHSLETRRRRSLLLVQTIRESSTPEELFVELDEQCVFTLIEHPEEVKAAVERERILDAVVAFEGATADKIAEEVELPPATVRRHLGVLRDTGHVVQEGEGKRGDPFRWRPSVGDEAAA